MQNGSITLTPLHDMPLPASTWVEKRSTEHRPYYAHDYQQPVEPGRICHFEIEIWPTSWVFKKGHRVRLELANADSPVFDAPFSHHYGTKIGTDTMYHDAQHLSHLDLPVIPRSRSGGCHA